ncbi:MAG: SIMPL domain-containing protein [Planctomycetes bacterium]|nr:SIMPL domain-containing protein [Planctomycetota bacterium]
MLRMLVSIVALSTLVYGQAEGIAVSGKASINVKPTRVEFRGRLSSTSELAADAITKFNQARRRSLEAIAGLEMPNLRAEGLGLRFSLQVAGGNDANAFMMDVGGGEPPEIEVALRETVLVTLTGIDTVDSEALLAAMAKIVDTMQKSGLSLMPANDDLASVYFGFNPMATARSKEAVEPITLHVADRATLEQQAFEAAVADARQRATQLATLCGVGLGKPRSVKVNGLTSHWLEATGEFSCAVTLDIVFGIE